MLVIGLIGIPMQTFVEEYVFRGPITKNQSVTVSVLPSILFMLAHIGNTEVARVSLMPYLIISLVLSAITNITGTIDYAWGIHLINNLYCIHIFGVQESSMPGLCLFCKPLSYTIADAFFQCLYGSLSIKLVSEFDKAHKADSSESFYKKACHAYRKTANDLLSYTQVFYPTKNFVKKFGINITYA